MYQTRDQTGLMKLGLTLGISLGTFILLSQIVRNANSGRGRPRSKSSRYCKEMEFHIIENLTF